MDFIDQLKQFAKRAATLKDTINTEEATKTAIIMPFFAMLGYDVFNPQEFVPEFTADVGIKKGEKVDYAIIKDDKPVILIECKSISENLDKHDSQLFRYFGTSDAKFSILTNGIIYRFFTDLDEPNKMDTTPFLEVDILNLRDSQVAEIKKFSKQNFEVESIFSTASALKYEGEFKSIMAGLLDNPPDDFVRLFLQNAYDGVKTQAVVDKFRPILKKALADFIAETLNDKIKSVLGGAGNINPPSTAEKAPAQDTIEPDELKKKEPRIVTTEEELEGYFIIKNALKDVAGGMDNITYKDTESYFNILYKGNTRKWICRLKLTDHQKTLMVPTETKDTEKYTLSDIYDILNHKDRLTAVLERYI